MNGARGVAAILGAIVGGKDLGFGNGVNVGIDIEGRVRCRCP